MKESVSHVLTILTPVYNRSEELVRLYHSLLKQTNRKFDWLVVDDGSSNPLEDLVQNMYADFNIKYI